jgi:hypothetical protein
VSQFPPPDQPGAQLMKPHRAGTVLALGILGIVVCFICGIIAWVMSNADLREMDSGRMDPSGRDVTKAGRICGIIGTILGSIGMCLGVCWLAFVISIMATAAARAGAGSAPGTPPAPTRAP